MIKKDYLSICIAQNRNSKMISKSNRNAQIYNEKYFDLDCYVDIRTLISRFELNCSAKQTQKGQSVQRHEILISSLII